MGREWRPDHDRASEALQPGKPAATDRHGLPSLTHSFTLDFAVVSNAGIAEVKAAKQEIKDFLHHELHLVLSEEKTRITHVNEGFDLLGFHLQRVKSEGRWVVHLRPSAKAKERVKQKVKSLTSRTWTWMDEYSRLTTLNAVVRGWANYFRHTSLVQDIEDITRYTWHPPP